MIKQKVKNLCFDLYYYFIYLVVRPSKEIPTNISKIVFVCKGNVCRSPMAEYIAKATAKKYGLEHLVCYSRGIEVSISNPPEDNAVLVCESKGINMSSHRSTVLSKEDMIDADLILVMEYKQVKNLCQKYPLYNNKIRLLPRFINRNKINSMFCNMIVIHDPYGCSLSDFERCYTIVAHCISNLFEDMQALRAE